MTDNRLADFLDHMRQAAADACEFVEGMDKADFLQDKRTQQAVILSLIVLGKAATKVMDRHPAFAGEHAEIPWRSMRACATASRTVTLTSTLKWCGKPCRANSPT